MELNELGRPEIKLKKNPYRNNRYWIIVQRLIGEKKNLKNVFLSVALNASSI